MGSDRQDVALCFSAKAAGFLEQHQLSCTDMFEVIKDGFVKTQEKLSSLRRFL